MSVVGIGSSAGNLDALNEFFRAMPEDSGLAFVFKNSTAVYAKVKEASASHDADRG